jgi:hypothetical protein
LSPTIRLVSPKTLDGDEFLSPRRGGISKVRGKCKTARSFLFRRRQPKYHYLPVYNCLDTIARGTANTITAHLRDDTEFKMDEDEINPDNAVAEGHEQPAAEILQLLAYPENVVDLPEMQIMYQRGLSSKAMGLRYKKDILNAVFCIVGVQVNRMPTTNSHGLHQTCMTIFSQLVENNGQNLLANTIGLFVYLPNQTIPADVYQYLVDFCTKEVNKESRAATKATKVVVTEQEASMILRGKIIFDTYCSAKNAVNNLMNPLYREPKSGENTSGVLMQVRMTLYKDHMKSLQREKLMRESRNLAELKGKSNAADREAWIVAKLVDYVDGEFDADWYPSGWMIFCLCGKPAGA